MSALPPEADIRLNLSKRSANDPKRTKKNPARGGASKSDIDLSRYRSKPEEDVAIRSPLSLTRPKQTQRIIQPPQILEIPEYLDFAFPQLPESPELEARQTPQTL